MDKSERIKQYEIKMRHTKDTFKKENNDKILKCIHDILNQVLIEFEKPDIKNKYYDRMMKILVSNQSSCIVFQDMIDVKQGFITVCGFKEWKRDNNSIPVLTIQNRESIFEGCRITIECGNNREKIGFADVFIIGIAPIGQNKCCAVM